MKRVFIVLLLGISLVSGASVNASAFNPEAVISDEDFFDANSLTAEEIQRFLERKGSSLATYQTKDIDGLEKRAADIIIRAAQTHGINPKVLLVLLQKEQSLIENPKPSQYSYDWATGFARCDSCSASDPKLAAYKGFVMQVEKAAWRKKYYTLNPDKFQFKPGVMKLVDGYPVTPTNWATAALYNYTPHLRGNFSFWKLWNRYFARIFPDGVLVKKEGSPEVWLIQDGKRRLFSSLSAFQSRFEEKNIITVPSSDLEKYDAGSTIKFPQYSLLQAPTGAVFLYMSDKKYGIQSKKVFKEIGYNPEEIIKASVEDLDAVPTAGFISGSTDNPVGELVQNPKTGAVYYVQQEIKHPILEKAILTTNFAHRKIRVGKELELADLTQGDPVRFAEGTLLTTPAAPTVYIISNGQKRSFFTGDAFTAMGFQWSQIVQTNGSTLDLHEEGNPIDLGTIVDEDFKIPVITTALK